MAGILPFVVLSQIHLTPELLQHWFRRAVYFWLPKLSDVDEDELEFDSVKFPVDWAIDVEAMNDEESFGVPVVESEVFARVWDVSLMWHDKDYIEVSIKCDVDETTAQLFNYPIILN